MVRIRSVRPLEGYRLELGLTDGRVVVRDVATLLVGPLFEPIRCDKAVFDQVFAANDSVAWPNGADLCPDVLIWGGPPPVQIPELSASAS